MLRLRGNLGYELLKRREFGGRHSSRFASDIQVL
jgi:hypothetical protein